MEPTHSNIPEEDVKDELEELVEDFEYHFFKGSKSRGGLKSLSWAKYDVSMK